MAVQKIESGEWINTEIPGETFTSRDAARAAKKIVEQEAAMDTYAENLAATEALDGAEDTEAQEAVEAVREEFSEAFEQELNDLEEKVVRETAAQVRARENVVYMALYADTETARAYWTKLAQERGYELPVTEPTV